MAKTLILGHSGSGKSTLAKHLSVSAQLSHLDLDTLAWQVGEPPQRAALAQSTQAILDFTLGNND